MKPAPLLVLYVPSLDRRRLAPDITPFLCRCLAERPVVDLATHPSVELLPSLVTGVWPHEHRVWQVRLLPDAPRTPAQRLVDALPRGLVTLAQCVRHRWDPDFDLPTVEPRRRRRFEMHRLKMLRRRGGGLHLVDFGTCPTLFAALPGASRHRTFFTFPDAKRGLAASLDPACRLDLVELYALDLFSHWNLDRPEAMRNMLRLTDELLREAAGRARHLGLRTLLVVDHGQEPVRHAIDLPRLLAGSGVPRDEYSFFIEITNARFWFFTPRARDVLVPLLGKVSGAALLDNAQMAAHHVGFADSDGFGDAYLITEAGTVFFPHDFYHPFVNWYMSRATDEQRARRRSPIHRGSHGHLPGPPADTGYLVALDDGLQPVDRRAELTDVAPTLLALAGVDALPGMKGRALYGRPA